MALQWSVQSPPSAPNTMNLTVLGDGTSTTLEISWSDLPFSKEWKNADAVPEFLQVIPGGSSGAAASISGSTITITFETALGDGDTAGVGLEWFFD